MGAPNRDAGPGVPCQQRVKLEGLPSFIHRALSTSCAVDALSNACEIVYCPTLLQAVQIFFSFHSLLVY